MFGFGKSKEKKAAQKEIDRLTRQSEQIRKFVENTCAKIDNDPSLYKWQKQKQKRDVDNLYTVHCLKTGEKMRELKEKLK